MVGRTVGRYHVVAKLGEGGMGSVWRAQDTVLRRTVALKFLPSDVAGDAAARRRFVREASATSVLDHPSIAALYEIAEWEDQLFIAVAYVEGETVNARIARGPIPIPDVVRVGAEAAAALAHAHAHGVVHRDVTSRNIMITPDGGARVIDFGLAFREGATRITSSDTTLGTLHYMPPEALLGQRVDERGDIYSLGVVLYEMLTGSVPYPGHQPAEVVYEVMQGSPPAPSERRAEVPAAVDAVVMRAIAREPKDRYASAAEMAAELRALAPGATAGAGTESRADDGRTAGGMGAGTAPRRPILVRLPRQPRVAIAPFRETSADERSGTPDQAFAVGLADHIGAALARDPNLQVIPPAALGPGEEPRDVCEAARRAGANLVLQGWIRRAAGTARVSFSLLDPAEGTLLAGDTLEGPTADWFRIEDELLEQIARALELRPAAGRSARMESPAGHERLIVAVGHLQRGDDEPSVDAALEIIESLLGTEGESAAVEAALAKACFHKFVLTQDPAWISRAKEACRQAMRADPHSPEVLATLGRIQIQTGRDAEAVRTFTEVIALRPNDHEGHQYLSTAFEHLGRYEEAELAVRKAIELRPGYWGGHNRLGNLMGRQGKYEEAAEEFSRVVALTPDNTQGFHNRATVQLAQGRLEEAAADYRASLAIRPSATAYTGLGTVLFFSGQGAEAEEPLRSATGLRPRDPMMWGNLADAQRWLPGRESESRHHFERAVSLVRERLKLNPQDGESWSGLALWLSKLGRSEEALLALGRAQELAPGLSATTVRAATVYHLAGQCERARESFARAWARGWNRAGLERDPELATVRKEVAARNPPQES